VTISVIQKTPSPWLGGWADGGLAVIHDHQVRLWVGSSRGLLASAGFISKSGALAEFSMARRKIFSVTNLGVAVEKVAGINSNKRNCERGLG
jgi:hypothetical protein